MTLLINLIGMGCMDTQPTTLALITFEEIKAKVTGCLLAVYALGYNHVGYLVTGPTPISYTYCTDFLYYLWIQALGKTCLIHVT